MRDDGDEAAAASEDGVAEGEDSKSNASRPPTPGRRGILFKMFSGRAPSKPRDVRGGSADTTVQMVREERQKQPGSAPRFRREASCDPQPRTGAKGYVYRWVRVWLRLGRWV